MQQTQTNVNKYYLYSVGAAVLWAFMVIPIRQLHTYNPYLILLCRILLATVLLYLYILCFNRAALKADIQLIQSNQLGTKKIIFLYITLSGLCLAINWLTYIYLIVKIDIKSASLVYFVTPLLLAIGAFLIYKDAVDKFKIISLVIAFGVLVSFSIEHLASILYVISCSAAYTIFILIQKKLPRLNKLNLFAFQLTTLFIIALPIFIYQVHLHTISFELFYWIRLLSIALLFTIVPMLLNLLSLDHLPASNIAMVIYLNPISTFVLGIIIFNEPLNFLDACLYFLLLTSVVIFNWTSIKKIVSAKKYDSN